MSSQSVVKRFGMATCALAAVLAGPVLMAQSSSSADYASQASSTLPLDLQYRSQYQNQYPSGGGYHQRRSGDSTFSHIAIEAGVGFASPLGNTRDDNTTGYSILAGGGYNFNKRLGAMLEYRFDRLGIQGSVINAYEQATGVAINGNTHAWSLTLDPVYNIKTSGHFGGYVTGGGGFYRLLTSFNTPVDLGTYCDYYYGCYEQYGNQTVDHYSSNQGGLNVGGGVTWKPNPDQHGAIFADVRYEWLDSPSKSTQILPVTFGYRW